MKTAVIIFLLAFSSGMAHSQFKKKFSKEDALKLDYCQCDSIYKAWPPRPTSKSNEPEFDGNGWNRLYNFQNNIGQCGYFEKFYFNYGLRFRYDEDGKLIKVQKYMNGKLIGTLEGTK